MNRIHFCDMFQLRTFIMANLYTVSSIPFEPPANVETITTPVQTSRSYSQLVYRAYQTATADKSSSDRLFAASTTT